MTDKKATIAKSAAAGKSELAAPGAILATSDGRTDYFVKPGVAWVNGRRVTGDKVRLTDAEARFDLDHGRISKKSFRSMTNPTSPKSGTAPSRSSGRL